MGSKPGFKKARDCEDLSPYRNKKIGIVISVVAAVVLVWMRFGEFNGFVDRQPTVIKVLVLIGCLSIWFAGVYIAPSLLSKDAVDSIESDERRPVLLLRSFSRDSRGINHGDRIDNPELLLTNVFSTIGPVIAIGKPGERLQSIGASRTYISHEVWKEEVISLMLQSQVIIVTIDTSSGLLWEIEQLATLDCVATKLLFLPPEDVSLSDNPMIRRIGRWAWPFSGKYHRLMRVAKQWQYSRIRRKLQHVLPGLPRRIEEASFLELTANGYYKKHAFDATSFASVLLKKNPLARTGYEQICIAEAAQSAVPKIAKIDFYWLAKTPLWFYRGVHVAITLLFAALIVFVFAMLALALVSEVFLGKTLDELLR